MRKYESKLNKLDEDPTYIQHEGYTEYDEVLWYIRYRRKWSSYWLEVYLASEDPVQHKATYALSWNGKELAGKDASTLKAYRKELYDWVVDQLPEPKDVTPTLGTPRLFKANVNKERWLLIDTIEGMYDADWILAESVDNPSQAKWKNYILYTEEDVPHKSTYYIAWNGERFAKQRDMDNLEEHRPELYNVVIEKLKEIK